MNIQLNEIYNMDCLEGMRYIPDKSIDMILCDLPYGITQCKWDSIIPLELLWIQYEKIIKDNGIIALTASQPFSSILVMSNIEMFRHEWIWEKDGGSNFGNVSREPMKEHEHIIVFSSGKWIYNPIKEERVGNRKGKITKSMRPIGDSECYNKFNNPGEWVVPELRYPKSIQRFTRERGLHPTQKPVELFEYLIKTYSNEGDTILDNCMGSGTTAIACMNTKRNFIGFELEKKYYDICIERINTRRNELSLDPPSV